MDARHKLVKLYQISSSSYDRVGKFTLTRIHHTNTKETGTQLGILIDWITSQSVVFVTGVKVNVGNIRELESIGKPKRCSSQSDDP